METEPAPLDADLRGQAGQSLERVDKFWPAIRIPGAVVGVDVDEDVGRPEDLGLGEGVGQEDCVPGGDVGDRDAVAHLRQGPVLGNGDVRG
jgi:hypothetical protein